MSNECQTLNSLYCRTVNSFTLKETCSFSGHFAVHFTVFILLLHHFSFTYFKTVEVNNLPPSDHTKEDRKMSIKKKCGGTSACVCSLHAPEMIWESFLTTWQTGYIVNSHVPTPSHPLSHKLLNIQSGHIHTKPELSLSNLFFFPHLKKYLRTHETTETDWNDVVYMPDQYVALQFCHRDT